MNKQTRNTTIDQQLGHEPIQMINLDECRRFIPFVNICPRCSVRSQLLLGLKKSPPVCIDCAIDPTFTNVQENWGEEGVIVHQGQEIDGHIGPSQVIIQHSKYSVFEQFHDRELVLLHNYSGRAFHLPRRKRKAFDVAKSEMPHLSPTQVLKTSAQNMDGLDGHRKTVKSHEQENSCPLLTSLLLGTQQAKLDPLTFLKQHAKPPGSTIAKICTALHQEKAKEMGINQPQMLKSSDDELNTSASFHANGKQATLPNLATSSVQLKPAKYIQEKAKQTRVTQPSNYHPGKVANAMANLSTQKNKAKLNDSRFAHERNSAFHELHNKATMNAHKANSNQMGVDLLNIQQVHNLHCSGMCWCALTNPSLNSTVELSNNCCVTGNWIPNQDISQIQGDSMSVYTPIMPFSDLRIREEHALPPEGTVQRFRVPEESIHKTESANPSSYALSSCYPNSILSYMLDKQDALLKPETSTELNTPPKCANDWPYNVVQNNIIQTDAEIANSKLFDTWHQRRIFCSNMANPMTLVDPIIHKQQVEQSQATNLTFSITTQEKQMDAETLANQNLENRHEFVNPQPLPRHAISTEQEVSPREALDLTYKFATKEDHNQRNTAKPSNREMGTLYPKSIINSDLVIAELSSTPTAKPKPLEGLKIAYEMARQENCTQIEAERTSKQQVLGNSYPYSIFNLPSTKLLLNSIEQVKPPEKKIERANIMTAQENCIQVKTEKASNNRMGTPLATSGSRVKTPQQAAILTHKTIAQDMSTQRNKGETRQLTNVDTSPLSNTQILQFETVEDLMNAFSIASRNTAQSNMEKDMGSGGEDELYIVQPYPKISNPEFTLQNNTCGISKLCPQSNKSRKMADFIEIGTKLVQNDSCVSLQEQVLKKETGSKLEQSLVQDDGTRNGTERGTKPRIQKAVRKPLKRSLEQNYIDCAEFEGKQSGANESECTKASISKYQPKERKVLNTSNSDSEKHSKTSESITRGGKDLTGSTKCTKTSRDDAIDSASSPTEVKKQNTGQNLQEDTGIIECTEECSRLKFQDLKGTFEGKPATTIDPVLSTCDESKNQARETTHELRKDFPSAICKKLRVQLSDIACCNRRGETFADALGKTAKTGMTYQSGQSHASKIVDLLVKQHEDWKDWSLEIDGESGLVLRNGKSISSATLPMDLDSNKNDNAFKKNLNKKTPKFHPQVVAKNPRIQEEECRESKSPDRKCKGKYLKLVKHLKVSQDPKRLGTLQLNKDFSISEDLPQYHYARKGKSMQKHRLKMKGMLKRAYCHVRKMYFTESGNKDKKNNSTYSLKLKSVQTPSSSKKNYKAGMNPKEQVPISVHKKKQWPLQQVSKRGNINDCDKKKGGRTTLSGKVSQDLKRQSTLQIRKWRPEDLPKSASAKKVSKSMKEYMEREIKKRLTTKMAAYYVRNLQDTIESKGSSQYNQDKGNCGRSDRANDKEETMPHQDLTQCSRNLKMFQLKDQRSHKPARVNISPSAKPKSREKSSKASPNKNYKVRMDPKKQFPPKQCKNKYQTPGQASKGKRSNTNDNRAQSTLQINQCSPEEEDFKQTMENFKQERHLKKAKEKLNKRNKIAVSHVRNLQNEPRPSNQDKVNCASSDTANEEEEAMSSQDLPQSLIDLKKVNLKEASKEELRPAQTNSAETKSEERSANVISNKDYKKGMSSPPKNETRNENDDRWTDRAIPLFDLVISRVVIFRRKRYSKQQNLRQSKSTQNKVRRTTQPLSLDPNTYHGNIEFTNPEYTAMCKHIEDLMEKDKFVDIFQVSTSQDELKDLQSPKAKSQHQLDPNLCHANIEYTDPEYTTMCKGKDISITEHNAPGILPLVIPQDVKNIGDQKCMKKQCTITSQDKLRDSYQREKCSEKRTSQYQESRAESCKAVKYCKALSILEFERDKERLLKRKFASPPNYNAKRSFKRSTNEGLHCCSKLERNPKIKCDRRNYINMGTPHGRKERTSLPYTPRQDCFNDLDRWRNAKESSSKNQTQIKDPQMRSKIHGESQNTTTNLLSASMSHRATSSQGGLQMNDPEREIQICVFDRHNQRINPNTEESIYSWYDLWIQSVPCNGQKSTQTQDMSKEKKKKKTLLTDGASLGFRESGYVTRSMRRRSFPELSFKHRNNMLNITVYSNAAGLWACVKELSKSGTFKRDKCFIALPNDARGHYEDVFGVSNESFYFEKRPINQKPFNYKRSQVEKPFHWKMT